MASGWTDKAATAGPSNKLVELASRALSAFSRWFQFEVFLASRASDSPGALIATWMGAAWRLGRVVVPVLFVGSVVTATVVMVIPSPTNDFVGIVAAAALGTLLMVPTWTELAIVPSLIGQGLTGPAAALLLTLPAVSIPCLVIIGAGTANYRAALLLGVLVFAGGVAAGLWFPVA